MSSDGLARCQRDIAQKARVIIFTGAGASAESGIPVFRSSISIKRLAIGVVLSLLVFVLYSYILGVLSLFISLFFLGGGLWNGVFGFLAVSLAGNHVAWKRWPRFAYFLYNIFFKRGVLRAQPNIFHKWCASIAERTWIITSNVDGLHQKAGSYDHRVFECHGTVHNNIIVNGITRPDIVFFGEHTKMMPYDHIKVLNEACEHKNAVVLLVGMSGMVPTNDLWIAFLKEVVPTYVIDPRESLYTKRANTTWLQCTAVEFAKYMDSSL